MQKITYVNPLGGKIVLTNSAPFLLQKFTEGESVNIYNFKGTNQDGLTYLDNDLDVKDISLELYVIAKSKTELIQYRNMVLKTLNPKLGEGYLLYEDDIKTIKIKCIVSKIPSFTTVKNSEGTVSSCIISLMANNPYWTDLLELKEEIAVWTGDLEFPLSMSSDGIEMGHRELSLMVNVINTGDVDCGMRIEFKAIATVNNPTLMNVVTGEFIKINKTMVSGEVISINTNFGNKSIISTVNGVVSNIFNNIDFNSTFIQLDVGDNIMRYDASTGIDNLEVSIYYNPKYLGV
jgi:hypothetical protein